MSEGHTKLLQCENTEKVRDMILKFRQCADAAADLSNSVEKFTDIYLSIEKNVTELRKVERNLNSNDYIKELLVVTDNMKDIFNYFTDNIPQLSRVMQSSKKELDLHKNEFKFVLEQFSDLNNQVSNQIEKIKLLLNEHFLNNKNMLDELQGHIENENKKIDNKYRRIKKTVLEEIKKELDVGLVDFQKQTLKLIDDSVNGIINEKVEFMINNFDDISNNLVRSISGYNHFGEFDTIYSLYVSSGRILPINVRRRSWTADFYFKVEKIEQIFFQQSFDLIAYGKRFKGNNYYDTFSISAGLKEFQLYIETYVDDGEIPF